MICGTKLLASTVIRPDCSRIPRPQASPPITQPPKIRVLSAIILQIRQFLINIPFFAVFAGCTFQTKTVSDKFHIASFPRKNRLFAIGFQLVSLKISRQNIRTVRIHLIQKRQQCLVGHQAFPQRLNPTHIGNAAAHVFLKHRFPW